jgi:hypothetical protein
MDELLVSPTPLDIFQVELIDMGLVDPLGELGRCHVSQDLF